MKKFITVLMAISMTFMFTATALADLNDGLVAYYSFNGNANDESGNGNDGTVYGATPTEDRFGNPNRAFLFDGDDDWVFIADSPDFDFTDQFSLSLWLKLETSAPYYFPYHIIEQHESWGIGQRGWDIHLSIRGSSGNYYDTPWGLPWMTLTPGIDYHFVMTFDGTKPDSNFKIYKDGELVFTKDAPGEAIYQSDYNVVMSYYEPNPDIGPGYYFDGVIDDIRIYNRALSESEIQELYNEDSMTTIPATIDINPGTLNLKSKGNWITVYTELPEDYSVADIDIYSVILSKIDGKLLDPPLYTIGLSEIGDYDENDIPDLMVKFNRQELISLLEITGIIELSVYGELLDGTPFEGCTNIQVIDKGKK